jgi:phosphoglycolate phosphatase
MLCRVAARRVAASDAAVVAGRAYSASSSPNIQLAVFDKDGTLLNFDATWLPGLRESAARAAAGDAQLAAALCRTGGLNEDCLDPTGQMAQGTACQLAELWMATHAPLAARWKGDATALEALIESTWLEKTVRDATPLGAVEATLRQLGEVGVQAAVVTNDSEASARAQLQRLGWLELFGTVIGFDSGHGAKPGPGGVRAAIAAAGVGAAQSVMVGDSPNDVLAGTAAGCAFSVAICPDGQPLPAGLAGAACRMPNIEQLPRVIAEAAGDGRSADTASRT